MAGHARLKLLLVLAVLAAHLAAIDWFARAAAERESVLRTVATPMFTRLLQPEPPKEVKPPPAPRRVAKKRAAPREGSMAASIPAPEPVQSVPEAATDTVAQPQAEPAPPAAPVQEAAAPPAVVASAAAAPEASLDSWPTDTRLSYRLSGLYRGGELYGNARVQWQRDGASYQVRLDIDITPFVTMVLTSQGEVTPLGLVPSAYEEARQGKRRAAQFGERAIQLEGGKSAAKPAGVQDTASQFVELAHRFATGLEALEVGNAVSFWMARPGAVDLWTYDIVAREMLQAGQLGEVEAFHLKPRPIANPRGNVTAEMWFAPSLQYLPVRIKVNFGEQAYVDLMVDKIEQR